MRKIFTILFILFLSIPAFAQEKSYMAVSRPLAEALWLGTMTPAQFDELHKAIRERGTTKPTNAIVLSLSKEGGDLWHRAIEGDKMPQWLAATIESELIRTLSLTPYLVNPCVAADDKSYDAARASWNCGAQYSAGQRAEILRRAKENR